MPLGSDVLKKASEWESWDWLDRVDVVDFLERLDILNISHATADEVLFSCPFPGHSQGDSKPSAYMNDGSKDPSKTTQFKCHGCLRKGNAVTFYAEHEGITKSDAAQQLKEVYAPYYRPPKGGTISAEFESRRQKLNQREEDELMETIPFVVYEELFAVDWYDAERMWEDDTAGPEVAYLLNRGFTAPTLDRWDIGYDSYTERLTIPVFDQFGALVGVKGRTWKSKRHERVKYKILGDKPGKAIRYGFTPYEKSKVVFGLQNLMVETHDQIVLVEGELDVIALDQIGIHALSTGSASVSEDQARLICEYAMNEVIIFFDTDTAGKNSTWGYNNSDGEYVSGVVARLEPFVRVRVVEDHEQDASELVQSGTIKELERLINNAVSTYKLQRNGEVL